MGEGGAREAYCAAKKAVAFNTSSLLSARGYTITSPTSPSKYLPYSSTPLLPANRPMLLLPPLGRGALPWLHPST